MFNFIVFTSLFVLLIVWWAITHPRGLLWSIAGISAIVLMAIFTH